MNSAIIFFYITCVLVEALAFTRLATPFAWFVLITIFSAFVWALFVYDQRIIRTRIADSAGPAACRLYALVTQDQRLNIGSLFLLFSCSMLDAPGHPRAARLFHRT